MTENTGNQQNIQLDINDAIAKGAYANLSISAFSQDEFILDFAFLQPHVKKANVISRIILNPKQAKGLAILLQQNITQYETKYGSISDEPNKGGVSFSAN